MFAGACIGSAAHQIVGDALPVVVAIPCGLVAVPCAFTPVLFSMVSLTSTLLALGGPATGPVFVAAMTSYTTVCGLGIVQRALAKKLTRIEGALGAHLQDTPGGSVTPLSTTAPDRPVG